MDDAVTPQAKRKASLTAKILIGMTAGIVAGLIINRMPEAAWAETWLTRGVFTLLGDGFIRAIKMLVVPLVFISLVAGACGLGDVARLGRVGAKTMGFYLVTTALAITWALLIASLIQPGVGLDLSHIVRQEPTLQESQGLVAVLLNLIPDNPVGAMASGNMLQVIFFALLLGISLAMIGEAGRPATALVDSLNAAVMKMVHIIMLFAPYGVFGLIARTFATVGFEAMLPLGKYMIAVLLGLTAHMFLTYAAMIRLLAGLSPVRFLRNIGPAATVAFSTSSSNATLPATLECVQRNMGVSRAISSFTIPLGATINMDGTAIMQGTAAVFIAEVYGVDLTLGAMLMIILTATLASIGAAGVPSVGLITLAMVLESVGLPVEGIALIIGIDRLLDMCRTVTNISGDAVCTVLVAKSEGEFDREVFDSENAMTR